jgi:hypothetical protein
MACQWLPESDIEQLTGIGVGSKQQSGTTNSSSHTCTYADQNGNFFLSVADDAETPDQFLSNVHNLFPTSAQPDVRQNVGVGDASVLVNFHSTSYILYVHAGTKGFVLSNINSASLGADGLIKIAGDLVNRTK